MRFSVYIHTISSNSNKLICTMLFNFKLFSFNSFENQTFCPFINLRMILHNQGGHNSGKQGKLRECLYSGKLREFCQYSGNFFIATLPSKCQRKVGLIIKYWSGKQDHYDLRDQRPCPVNVGEYLAIKQINLSSFLKSNAFK